MDQQEFPIDASGGHAFCVRVSAIEYKQIQKMMKAQGLNGPELFRRALLSRTDLARPLLSADEAKVFGTELRRQGNNVNQIAKKFNSGLTEGWHQDINSLVRGYVDLRHLLTVNRADR
jgi:Bacterial mobilisation protein (MobC)